MRTRYEVKYECETCGIVFSKLHDAEVHEQYHIPPEVTQYVDNKPTLGKAVLEAVVKEKGKEVPEKALISYDGKHAWYRLQWPAPWEDR